MKPFTGRELIARVEAQLLRARIRSIEDEHRRRVAEVFTHAPVPIAVLRGPTHVYELANGPYLELVGRPDIVGRSIREALPELEGQGIRELLDDVYESGERFIGRSRRALLAPTRRRRRAGRMLLRLRLSAHVRCARTRGRNRGRRVRGHGAGKCPPCRRGRQSSEKTSSLAMLGHELLKPARADSDGAAAAFRLRGVQAGERERTIIERQVRHLVSLVDDLLDISRITRGKIRLNRVPIDLNEMVAKGIELASPLLEQHQHDLVVDVPEARTRGHG